MRGLYQLVGGIKSFKIILSIILYMFKQLFGKFFVSTTNHESSDDDEVVVSNDMVNDTTNTTTDLATNNTPDLATNNTPDLATNNTTDLATNNTPATDNTFNTIEFFSTDKFVFKTTDEINDFHITIQNETNRDNFIHQAISRFSHLSNNEMIMWCLKTLKYYNINTETIKREFYTYNLLRLLDVKLNNNYLSNIRNNTIDSLLTDIENNTADSINLICNNVLNRSITLSKYIDNDNIYDFYTSLTLKELELLYLYM